MGEGTLGTMLENLRTVDDRTWGCYAFSRDILCDRIPPGKRDKMIHRALDCGVLWAERIRARTGMSDPFKIAEDLGLDVVESSQPMTERRVLFAQFVPDKRIEIMRHPLDIYAGLYQKQTDNERAVLFPTPGEVRALLLAHEVFHYIEETHAEEIYTRTESIRLWKFLCFKNDSAIRAIGEIAAMSFAKTLTEADYSPFILDVLLLFGYHPAGAESIYADVMAIANRTKIQEKVETD